MKNLNNQSQDQPNQSDRSHLADLYPQAKTLEDRVYDQQQKAQQQASRRPKTIVGTTVLQLLGLIIGLVAAAYLSTLSLNLNIISGVSFSVLLILIWLASAYWVFASISARFAALGYSARPFLAAYVMLYPAGAYGLSRLFDPVQETLVFGVAAVVLHLVLTTILMRLVGARS